MEELEFKWEIIHFDNEMLGSYHNTKTCLFKYIENFSNKNWKLSNKIFDIFHISAQNIDFEYSLNRLAGVVLTRTHILCVWAEIRKNNVNPCKPQFYYIKVEFKGVKII